MSNHSLNAPELWRTRFPWPKEDGNKYHRGHAIVVGGPVAQTGAARLAAIAALRIGAGLVSVVCDSKSLPVYASALTAVMTKVMDDLPSFEHFLQDERCNAVLIGPGCGLSNRTRDFTLAALRAKKKTVLDADALNSFAENSGTLFHHIKSPVILTPHEGEFARLFPDLKGEKVVQAQKAAGLSGAIVVFKGNQTVIAAPDGKTMVSNHSTLFLATAGTGDVLAGMILGLVAQGMEMFDAACAATWMHGEAARQFGPGLTAEDIEGLLAAVMARLWQP